MAKLKRKLSAQAALEWAFRNEAAQLDLVETRGEEDRGTNVGTEYVLMERAKLGGVQIDVSPGRSSPHEDADIIAGILSGMAAGELGRGPAVRLAACAKLGTSPDWMPGAVPQIFPLEWKRRGGFSTEPMAKTEILRRGVRKVKQPHPRNRSRTITRKVEYVEEWCPITYDPHPRDIEIARADYLEWWTSLDLFRQTLSAGAVLRTIELVDFMPPRRPWQGRRVVGRSSASS